MDHHGHERLSSVFRCPSGPFHDHHDHHGIRGSLTRSAGCWPSPSGLPGGTRNKRITARTGGLKRPSWRSEWYEEKNIKKKLIIEKLYRIWIVQLISEEYTSFLVDNMNILYWKEHILKWIEKNMSDHSWSFLNSKHHAWSNPQNDQVEKCVATRLPLVKTVTFHGWAGLWYPFLLISNTHRGPRGAFNVH